MSLNNVYIHEGFVPAYQVSSLPWVTSSVISLGEIHAYNFPLVTRFISIANRGSTSETLSISFTQNGLSLSSGKFFSLDGGSSFREEIRTTTLFISCSAGTVVDYNIVAGLTCILPSQFTLLTGSNSPVYEGVG